MSYPRNAALVFLTGLALTGVMAAPAPKPGGKRAAPAPAPKTPPQVVKTTDDPFRPLLMRYCQACHVGDRPQGGFSLASLSPDFSNEANRKRWQTVLKRVRAGEMPPKSSP